MNELVCEHIHKTVSRLRMLVVRYRCYKNSHLHFGGGGIQTGRKFNIIVSQPVTGIITNLAISDAGVLNYEKLLAFRRIHVCNTSSRWQP